MWDFKFQVETRSGFPRERSADVKRILLLLVLMGRCSALTKTAEAIARSVCLRTEGHLWTEPYTDLRI